MAEYDLIRVENIVVFLSNAKKKNLAHFIVLSLGLFHFKNL